MICVFHTLLAEVSKIEFTVKNKTVIYALKFMFIIIV